MVAVHRIRNDQLPLDEQDFSAYNRSSLVGGLLFMLEPVFDVRRISRPSDSSSFPFVQRLVTLV